MPGAGLGPDGPAGKKTGKDPALMELHFILIHSESRDGMTMIYVPGKSELSSGLPRWH